ncbi:MAG: (2Fe-2S) ferredoxin domain-containing protein, partial [Candidatus Krumholzibacteriaceae bacterium]
MNRLESVADLKSLQEKLAAGRDPRKPCVVICAGTGCLAYGVMALIDRFKEELKRRNLSDRVD